ncbi:MAG TPA: trypsin-like peptidase domain-containing protein [Paracoccaceae bacterium]|nr:trypsin-like peptidase domain-containing protein [Paracoccaceae bacterium]
MKHLIWTFTFLTCLAAAGLARAQDTWVQIEAQPSLSEAQERAQAYAGAFPNVQGYKLGSGWYGILLGPFTPEEAARQLDLLRQERMIPSDSFIAESGALGRRFWPAGTTDAAPSTAPAPTTGLTPTAPEVAPAAPVAEEPETMDQALASESALVKEDRLDIQRAMQFFGTYPGKIDGSFGKGTRAAMAAWQATQGLSETGVLTTTQRAALIEAWQAEVKSLGLTSVIEDEAGIVIDLPLGLVAFDRYAPPFVTYSAKDGSGYQVLLISRQGDARALVALYDQVQALELVPMEGPRDLKASSFSIDGQSADRLAHVEARLEGGLIKGFALIGPTGDDQRRARVLAAMQASFTPKGSRALDENLGEPSATPAADLAKGLEVRHPALSRSGAYIDATGTVLTTAEVVAGCTRLTLDGRHTATVAFKDDALGIAVLKPDQPLAPRAVAELAPALPRLDSDVSMAGYSYEDRLDAPVISSGTFSEATGLNGEAELARLTLQTLPGDVGGAVLDGSGAMIGMLAPRKDEAGRELPKDVSFILQGAAIAAALKDKGFAPAPSTRTGTLAAEDLAKRARDMTVLVSCWK